MPAVLIPTPPELDENAELAVLAALEAALLAAEFAVIASQPLLRDPDAPLEPTHLYWSALALVNRAADMQQAISAYRGALTFERRRLRDP